MASWDFTPPNCYNLGRGGFFGFKIFVFDFKNNIFSEPQKGPLSGCFELCGNIIRHKLAPVHSFKKNFLVEKTFFFFKNFDFWVFFCPNMVKIKIELKKRIFIRFWCLYPQNFRHLLHFLDKLNKKLWFVCSP